MDSANVLRALSCIYPISSEYLFILNLKLLSFLLSVGTEHDKMIQMLTETFLRIDRISTT